MRRIYTGLKAINIEGRVEKVVVVVFREALALDLQQVGERIIQDEQ